MKSTWKRFSLLLLVSLLVSQLGLALWPSEVVAQRNPFGGGPFGGSYQPSSYPSGNSYPSGSYSGTTARFTDPFGDSVEYIEEWEEAGPQLSGMMVPGMNGEMPELTPEQKKIFPQIAPYLAIESIRRTPASMLEVILQQKKNAEEAAAEPGSEVDPETVDGNPDPQATPDEVVEPVEDDIPPPPGPTGPEDDNEAETADDPDAAIMVPSDINEVIDAEFGEYGEYAEPTVDADLIAKVAEFQQLLTKGDWVGVKEHLQTLPEAGRPLVYGHALKLMSSCSMVSLQEIPAMAAAAPEEMSRQQIAMLGAILTQALHQADEPDEFLAKLETGFAGFGGQDQADRRRAAMLLMAASLMEPAADYMQPLDAGTETDWELRQLHAEYQHILYQVTESAEARDLAWDLSEQISRGETATEEQRQAAVGRAITLLPEVPIGVSGKWVTSLLEEDSGRVADLAKQIARSEEIAFSSDDRRGRARALKSAQIICDSLLRLPEAERQDWKPVLQLLLMPWINESLKTNEEYKRVFSLPNDSDVSALPGPMLAASAPSEEWLEVLTNDSAAMARRLKVNLLRDSERWEELRQTAKIIAGYDEEAARNAVDAYFQAKLNVDSPIADRVEEMMQDYINSGYPPSQLQAYRQHFTQQLMEEGGGSGIALTRARQVKALKEMQELLVDIDAHGLPAPSPETLVQAFVSAHSMAEVYQQEDMEQVFGPLDELPEETTLALISRMRQNLAQQWRNKNIQQHAGTERTDDEMQAELVRGYDLAIELATKSLESHADNIAMRTAAGMIYFDKSEFLYGMGADMPTYVGIRDQAFEQMQQAAAVYAKSIKSPSENTSDEAVEEPELSPDVYLRWFQASLGASDLAYLTRQDAADATQIQKMAAAIDALGEPMADKHRELFGEALSEEIDNLPAPLKPRCLREALNVIGDHPAGDKARELLRYYDELLAEVHLHLELDGKDIVGHGQSFGARLSIRYSNQLGREATHFTSLLGVSYDPSGTEINNKEAMENDLRERLAEAFDISELRFYPPTVTPQSYGRSGWKETPLVYLVMSAKDPAIDTIPELQVDVQFNDGVGTVLLPIASRKLLIDARDNNPPPRPVSDVSVRQLLDARQAKTGKMRLEVVVQGRGLIPSLEEVLQIENAEASIAGFPVESLEDHGVTVVELGTTGDLAQPKCERTWLIDLKMPTHPAKPVSAFEFPATKDESYEPTYEQYQDADIVACEQTVPLDVSVAGGGSFGTVATLASVAGVSLLGFGLLFWVRRRKPAAAQSQLAQPEVVTPFSLIAFLRRLERNKQINLGDRDREILAGTIADLEGRFFSNRDSNGEAEELKEVFDEWYGKAQRLITLPR